MPEANFRIEEIRPEDLEAVLRIEAASFTHPWTREMFEAELVPEISLVLGVRSEDDTLWGYLFGSIVEGTFHISNVAVDARVRRQGVGTKLLRSALVQASRRGAKTATLEVRASNLTAQALYRDFGFTVVGRRRRYYARPLEDGLIMTLDGLGDVVKARSAGEKA
jgi:[ribosomal protein S18]-alanine N-acetyltransferase